jgi:hypothetical protein
MYKDSFILDKSPDLQRALAISEVYYGDESSLIALYNIMGRPVLFQAFDSNPQKNFNLYIYSLYEYNNNLWLISPNLNGLLRMDKNTFIPELIGFFNNENPTSEYQYYNIILADDILLFAPILATKIALYNIKSNNFEYIDIPMPQYNKSLEYKPTSEFVCLFKYAENIYFIPKSYPGILQFNISTKEINVIDSWINELHKHLPKNTFRYFNSYQLIDAVAYIPCLFCNGILEIELDTLSYNIRLFRNKSIGYRDICYDGNDLWLLPLNISNIVKYNPLSGQTSEYSVIVNDPTANNIDPFSFIRYYNSFIWIFPSSGDYAKVTKINVKTGQATAIDQFQQYINNDIDKKIDFNQTKISFAELIGDEFYAFSNVTRSLLIYNCINDNIREVKIDLTDNDFAKLKSLIYNNAIKDDEQQNIFSEENIPLKTVIENINPANQYTKDSNESAKNNGKKIFEYIKKNC